MRKNVVMSLTIFLSVLAILTACSVFCGCGQSKHINCRAEFEKYYEVNVQAYMKTVPDMDTVIARWQVECILNKLYEIDSTYVLKDGAELRKFIDSHRDVINQCIECNKCDSL